MRLFGWFRFPAAPRALVPHRRPKLRRRVSTDWQSPGGPLAAAECLERRSLLAATLSVSNPAPFAEGDSGTANMVFVVTRTGDLTSDIKVNYATADGTALAGVDYVATAGSLDFGPGVTSLPVNVPVIGNTVYQPNRTFTLALSSPTEVNGPAGFATVQTFAAGSAPDGLTVVDLNGDGLKDMVLIDLGTSSLSVLLNTTGPGSATASFATQQTFALNATPRAVTMADINGDGRPDLLVTTSAGAVSILLNTTAAGASTVSFAAPQTFASGVAQAPGDLTVADLNGDGRPDVIVGNDNANGVSVLLNTTTVGSTTAGFAPTQFFATGTKPSSVFATDINGDGRKDLIVANRGSNSISVLLNTTSPGSTTPGFASQQTFATGASPVGVTAADINGDGLPDLVVANYNSTGSISVLLNTTAPGAAQPSFAAQQTFACKTYCSAVAAADFNGDGKPDILVAEDDNSAAAAVLVNQTAPGSTTVAFAAPSTFAAGGASQQATVADLNGDGKLDLIVDNLSANTFSVLLNNTSQSGLTPVNIAQSSTFALSGSAGVVATGDFNGDGKPDLVVPHFNQSTVGVLLDTTAPGATAPSFAAEQTFAVGAGANSLAVTDINGDGRADLIVGSYTASNLTVLLNTTAPGAAVPSFAASQTFALALKPGFVASADINGDGRPDLIVASFGVNSVSVLLNTTAAGDAIPGFTAQQTFACASKPYSVAVADINGDGLKDLVVTNSQSSSVSVLLNTTAPGAMIPSFAPQTTFGVGSDPFGVATADFNGDGLPDIAVANRVSNTVSLLLNATAPGAAIPGFAGQVTFATGSQPTAVIATDLNNDGKPDLLVADSVNSPNATVLLNATISLAPAVTFTAGGTSFGATAADVNGDGTVDLILANNVVSAVSVLLTTPVTISGSPATGTIQDDDAQSTKTAVATTTPQSATVNSPFAVNLAVLVENTAGNPVSNLPVVFSVPGSGASGTFGTLSSVTVVTNSAGIATAPQFTANGTPGSYNVGATFPGDAIPTVNFSLTNKAATLAPIFTSLSNMNFAVGLAGSFTVTAAGTPAPTFSESNTDVLPAGVTFNAATGVLSGTPAAGTNGDYKLHFTATNGVLPNASQTFTLKVTTQPSLAGEYAVFSGLASPTLASIDQNGNSLTLHGSSTVSAAIQSATQMLVGGNQPAPYANGSIMFLAGSFAGQTWTKLDLPPDFTNQQGAAVHIMQNGTSVTFVNKFGGTASGTWVAPTLLSVPAFGETVTVSAGRMLWQDGSIWSENIALTGNKNGAGTTLITAAPSQVSVFDYVNTGGKAVHLIQTGTTNVVFVDGTGHMSIGKYLSPTQLMTPYFPNDIATISNDFTTITWTDGTVWTLTARTSAITVIDYTNQNGIPVHLVQNGTSQVAFVDGLGRTSLGTMLSPTTAQADLYPGDIATFSNNFNTVTWQDGFVWTQSNTLPLVTTFTDTNGAVSHVKLTSPSTLVGLDGPLQGLTATRVNNEIEWSNGDVWANFDFNVLNAMFEMGTGYP